MSYLNFEKENDIIEMLNKRAYYQMNCQVKFTDAEVVTENDEIKTVFELNWLKLQEHNDTAVEYLKKQMADLNMEFYGLDKEVWLGEIKYKLYFILPEEN